MEEGSSVGVSVGVGVTTLDEGPGVGADASLALLEGRKKVSSVG